LGDGAQRVPEQGSHRHIVSTTVLDGSTLTRGEHMTLWDLIRSMLRRWPIVLVGAVLTVAVGYHAAGDRGVYWAKTKVVFLAPSSEMYPNALETTSEDVIITAGLVAKQMMGPAETLKFTSPDANLIGAGVHDGWSVKLPDIGGQWAPNFADQWLDVEVVASTPEQVELRMDELIREIDTTLARLQRTHAVRAVNDITARAAPESGVVYHVSGSRPRVLAMTLALGVGATVWTVLLLDFRTSQRRRREPLGARPAADDLVPVS
jgi:hypothetical protein